MLRFFFLFLSIVVTEILFHTILIYSINKNNFRYASSVTESPVLIARSEKYTELSNHYKNIKIQEAERKSGLEFQLKKYYPISMLDSRPFLIENIQKNLSAIFNDVSNLKFNCLLMINEYGDLDKILFGDNDLSIYQKKRIRKYFP